MASTGKYQIDMCHGPLLSKIVLVALPLMAANVMQVLFNAVDILVIGRYADKTALAAVFPKSVRTMSFQAALLGFESSGSASISSALSSMLSANTIP